MKNMIRCLLILFGLAILANARAHNGEPTAACDFVVVPTRTVPTCFGSSDGGIQVAVLGNNGPFSYVWSTGLADQPLTNIPAGDYTLTVTDALGCTQVDTVVLGGPTEVDLQLAVTPILCFGQPGGSLNTVVAGGVGNFTFSWSTGSNQPLLQNLTAGDYAVTVTDGNGCSKTAAATLTQPDDLTVAIISTSGFCTSPSTNGSITVQASGGTPPYKYIWLSHGSVMGPTISNVGPGAFYVCVTDSNNCQKDLPINIPQGGVSVTLVETSAQCPGQANGTITAVVDPPQGSYSFTWSIPNSPNGPQLTGLAAGTQVSVTVTEQATGCTATATGSISAHNQVQVNVVDVDVDCANNPIGSATATATHGTAPYTFVWTLPNGSTTTGNQITGLTAGSYLVSVTDAQGCTAVSAADITSLSGLAADVSFEVVDCDTSQVKVIFHDNSTDPTSQIVAWNWNIAWSTGAIQSTSQTPDTLVLPVNETGTVQLTVTSAAGCTATLSEIFAVGTGPNIAVGTGQPNLSCGGLPVHIPVVGSSNYTYQWSPLTGLDLTNPFDVVANPSQSTVYTLVVTNGGCQKAISVPVLVAPPIDLAASPDTVTCLDQIALIAATGAPNLTYQWSTGGTVVGGTATLSVNPTAATQTFIVKVTDGIGCTDSDTVAVTGIGVDLQLGTVSGSACENTDVAVAVTSTDPTDVNTYSWSSNNPNLSIAPPDAAATTVTGPAGNYLLTLLASNQNGCTKTIEVPLDFTDGASLAGQIRANLCNGLPVDFQNLTNFLGTWNFGDGATSTEANPTHVYQNPGPYQVTFTPNAACVAVFDTMINVAGMAALQANFGQDIQGCENEATFIFTDSTIHAAQITQWAWTFPPTTVTANEQNPTVIFPQAGPVTATLVVTDVNGCTDEFSRVVPFHIVTEEIAPSQELCTLQSVPLNPVFNTDYAYSWSASPADAVITANPLNPNPVVNPTLPTTYTVVITVGGCQITKSTTITPNIISDDIASQQTVCAGQTAALNPDGGSPYSYNWTATPADPVITANPTNPNPVVSPTVPTDYTVVITLGGCTATKTVQVTPFAISQNIQLAHDFCPNETVPLNPSANLTYTYLWASNPADPVIMGNPANPNPIVSPAVITNYTVTITFGTCQQVVENVVVTPNPAATVQASTANANVCSLDPVNLFAMGNGQSYAWFQLPGGQAIGVGDQISVIPVQNGLYEVVATTDKGCTSRDTVSLNNAVVSISYVEDKMICSDMSVQLDIQNNFPALHNLTFVWSPSGIPPIGNPVVNPSTGQSYSATVTNQFGCTATATINIDVVALEAITETEKDTICPGEETQLSVNVTGGSDYKFVWNNESTLDDPTSQNPIATPTQSTTYNVTVMDSNGCSTIASVPVTFMNLECKFPYIFVPKVFTPDNNGKNDLFMVRGMNIKEVYFAVFDRWGEKVFETNNPMDNGWDGTYKGKELTPDSYGWYLKALCVDGEEFISKGDVTLLK